MSFETMRQHQKKVFLPLAIVITFVFVFFFGAGSGGVKSLFSGDKSMSLDDRLIRLGQDLQSAGMIQPPPTKWFEYRAKSSRSHITDEKELKRIVRDEVRAQVRAYYRRMGAQMHHLPVQDGERLGVRITDVDLNDRVREHVEQRWGLKPFELKTYREELGARALTDTRFEELMRGQMIRARVGEMLTMTAGASEAEQYGAYSRDKQKVRVQYFQREAKSFVAKVQILPGKRPEEKKNEKDKAGEEPTDAANDKKAEKKDVGKLYEEEIKKKFDDRIKDINERLKVKKDDPDYEYPEHAANQYPELFTEPTCELEYLIALNRDFRRGIEVTGKEIEDEYKNNKEIKYRAEPKKSEETKAGEKDKPKYKALDRKLRKEIEEELLKNRAADAAAKALETAVKAYNDAKADDRPTDDKTWKAFAKKHKVARKIAGPIAKKALKKLKDFEGSLIYIDDLFSAAKRKELKEKFADRMRMDDDRGYLAFRLLGYQKRELLSFEKAKAGFTYRLKRLAAWDLTKEAIDADVEELKSKSGKLDAKRVRQSILLEPESEVSQVIRDYSIAIGQESKPFVYRELLGPELAKKKAEDEKKEADKEKKKDEKPLTLEEKVTKSLDRGMLGYRVVILVERKLPAFEDFRKDREWRKRWKPASKMDEYFLQYVERKQPRDTQWRNYFLQSYYGEKFERLLSRG